jgi:cyclopropane-fatty-acyl-phospholipid synthase
MSVQSNEFVSSSQSPVWRGWRDRLLPWLARVLGGRLKCGELIIEAPGGLTLALRSGRSGPQARLIINSWRALRRFILGRDIGFAEAYMAQELSTPNLVALLSFARLNRGNADPFRWLRLPRPALRIRHVLNRNTRRGSRRNIAAHYDLGNDFYRQWLDAGMTYSAGLFAAPDRTLEQAQDAKLDRVIELLELSGGESVLEIGCGWGGFAERLLRRTDCSVTGLTVSAEQLAYARDRLVDNTRPSRCDLRLQDYRDVQGRYDRIVSIEMLEAVGEAYWPIYFNRIWDRLRPGGVAVLQVITINEACFETYRRRPDFIQKYIFPGGMLPTKEAIQREAASAGFSLVASEFFASDYARTLAEWRARFHHAWPKIEAMGFDGRFRRMWDFYLAYCQVGFETGAIDVGLYKLVKSETPTKG